MNGTELTERLITDLDNGIKKQSSLGDVGHAALLVIADRLRVITETVNNSDQLITFNNNDLPKALEDIKQHKAEVANRIDTVLQNDSLVSTILISDNGAPIPIREVLIEQLDFLNKIFGAK